jgi:hypothetical protein
MVYRPDFEKQWSDPTTTLDWYNCTMAAGAMALDFDTLGHVDVEPGTLRKRSGDLSGGTGLGSPGLSRAWAYYGQNLHVETGDDWSGVIGALRAYRGVVLQGMYGALPKQYRSTLNSVGFTGPHAVYVNPEFQADGDALMGDPLNGKYIWVPQSALRSFAAALGASQLGSSSKLFFATTDAHKPAVTDPVAYVHTVQVTADRLNIRESPSAGSLDVGNLAKGYRLKTTHLRRYGGRYIVNGTIRTDWLGFSHNGETDWIARAYTKIV